MASRPTASAWPERFERDVGSSPADWLRCLRQALPPGDWVLQAHSAHIPVGAGRLALAWQEAPPRQIASIRLPRLLVQFRFEGVDAAARAAFMRRFDLYMQRGGG